MDKYPWLCKEQCGLVPLVMQGTMWTSTLGYVRNKVVVVVVALLFYVHGKHHRSCRDGQLT